MVDDILVHYVDNGNLENVSMNTQTIKQERWKRNVIAIVEAPNPTHSLGSFL